MAAIAREQVMPMLVAACPSFAPAWDLEMRDPGFDPDLLYLQLSKFAEHLVGLLASREIDEFAAAFDAVEQLHMHGDSYVREAATIGVLESLQSHSARRGLAPSDFCEFLGPESLVWWNKLNRFWNGDHAALREHRAP